MACVTVQARGVNDRKIKLLLGCAQFVEWIKSLVDHPVGARAGPVDLVDNDNRLQPCASAFLVTKRVCGIGPSTASTSSSTLSTIDRTRSTSPPKSAWPGVSTI